MRFEFKQARSACGFIAAASVVGLISGCATPIKPYDYTAFQQSRPASILVLPPVNDSPDVKATYSMYSHVTLPLAESGYYVYPVTLVDETFHQNGLTHPVDIHQVEPHKLREIFAADAALYIHVKAYGTTYAVLASESRVTADAKLIDLRSAETLWEGSATASSAEGRSSSGGLVGLLAQAIVNQIIESNWNRSHTVAAVTSERLLSAGVPNGILYGPRSPKYKTDGNTRP